MNNKLTAKTWANFVESVDMPEKKKAAPRKVVAKSKRKKPKKAAMTKREAEKLYKRHRALSQYYAALVLD